MFKKLAFLLFISLCFSAPSFAALHTIDIGGVTALGYDDVTGARGYLMRITNRTGTTSVLGSVVSNCPSEDNGACLQFNEFDAIGIVAESGIANGSPMWVWKSGSRCQVLWKDGQTATRGFVALCADTDGRALNIEVPTVSPVEAQHFKEIGHVCESKSSGTNVLVLCDVHFN